MIAKSNFMRKRSLHPRERIKKAGTNVVFVKKIPLHSKERLKADTDVVFMKKRPRHPQDKCRKSTPAVYFVKKRSWQKVRDWAETVESIAESLNFEFDPADTVNVPISANSLED